jgi:predicted O-methyltransferase YrrM
MQTVGRDRIRQNNQRAEPVRFTQDWFSAHAESWQSVLAGFRGKSGVRALEIGCFEGRATRWLLENILTGKGSGITVIDTFKGDPLLWADVRRESGRRCAAFLRRDLEKRFRRNVRDFADRVIVEVGRSQQILRRYGKEGRSEFFDVAYVDGSHRPGDVRRDAELAWPLMRNDGIVIFDDYEAFWGSMDPRQPKVGIDSFLSSHKGQYKVVSSGYQMILRKRE